MYIRPATHANSWYSGNGRVLESQLETFFADAKAALGGSGTQKGARILIGPHAGYTYSGARLAETFQAWDTSRVKRVFVLGPSHHIWFKNSALVSKFDAYSTPFGDIPIDKEVSEELVASDAFRYMDEGVDEDEHAFEMHCPFIYYRARSLKAVPKLIPIMISSMDEDLAERLAEALLPYFKDQENTFVISSDFCHWGSRFGYTEYVKSPSSDLQTADLATLRSASKLGQLEIWESIEYLDRQAMRIASAEGSAQWQRYIKTTKNTICGQKPVYVVLKLLEKAGISSRFEWIGYSQSGKAKTYFDSSVSYASGYVKL